MVQVIDSRQKFMTINPHDTDRLLAEALPEGVVILDKDGYLVWWNQIASYLLLLNDKQHQESHVDTIFHKALFKRLKKQDTIQISAPRGASVILQVRLRPYAESQHLLIIQDITLTRRLESMRQDFIANVSHELRTPLTVFHGYLELLKDGSMDISGPQFSGVIDQMTGQANRMMQLVEDLLLLSRLESVEPDHDAYQIVAVASLARDICRDAQSLSGEKQHQFVLELDESLMLSGDTKELRSAFSNLVYNAVHYTPEQGVITVRWYEEGHVSYFEVVDTGIGIADKDISRITQRFYRVDKGRSSAAGGTGLGLAIVKHVLLRHRGDLEIESKLGKGSVFRCSFVGSR